MRHYRLEGVCCSLSVHPLTHFRAGTRNNHSRRGWLEVKKTFPNIFHRFSSALPSTFDACVGVGVEEWARSLMWCGNHQIEINNGFLFCLQSAPHFSPSAITHNIKAHMAHSPLNWWDSFLCVGGLCVLRLAVSFFHLLAFLANPSLQAFRWKGNTTRGKARGKREKKSLPSESM